MRLPKKTARQNAKEGVSTIVSAFCVAAAWIAYATFTNLDNCIRGHDLIVMALLPFVGLFVFAGIWDFLNYAIPD